MCEACSSCILMGFYRQHFLFEQRNRGGRTFETEEALGLGEKRKRGGEGEREEGKHPAL